MAATPLERAIAREIRGGGPMSLARYMALCLGDPAHGYYMTRDPLGARGDFTTAPEINQMFGELIGLWAADTWMKLGAPAPFALVELGPGRGTLMADALRAAKAVPTFLGAAGIHLVETSPVLKERQRDTLGHEATSLTWHDRLGDIPPGPMIVIANEFLDALPVVQFERISGAWRERVVVLAADGALALSLVDPQSPPEGLPAHAPDGAIAERAPEREDIAAALAARFAAHPGAALIIDYGHAESGLGDTLQAVREHQPVGILHAPGECDLTSHVDFAALARTARDAGAACHGPLDMGAFLERLGIGARAARLKQGRDAAVRAGIEAALARLTAPGQMGSLFKVLAIASPGAPAPEPFAPGRRAE